MDADLVLVTRLGPDHPLIRSLVAQLLEAGVHFERGPADELLTEPPDDLADGQVIVFDAQTLSQLTSDANSRAALDRYAQRGHIFIADAPLGEGQRGFHQNCLLDHTMFHLVQEMQVHTRIAPRRAGTVVEDGAMLDGLTDVVRRYLERPAPSWDEMRLHFWKAGIALVERDAGHATSPQRASTPAAQPLRQALIESIRRGHADVPRLHRQDQVGGLFATAWLYDQTGNEQPLARVRRALDDMLAQRPRHQGVPVSCGFRDDRISAPSDEASAYFYNHFSHHRDVIWNEGMHFYGPALAAIARVTGQRAYLDEALRYIEHIKRYHLRKDGLLAHASSHGQPIGHAWGRGQSHALLGTLYVMDELSPNDPHYASCAQLIGDVAHALVRVQDEETGLWHNVVDRPDSRIETTATMSYVYLFTRGMREGWLDRRVFEPVVERAWRGVKRMYWRGGFGGCCRGTAIGRDVAYYLARPQGDNKTTVVAWAVMAAVERARSATAASRADV